MVIIDFKKNWVISLRLAVNILLRSFELGFVLKHISQSAKYTDFIMRMDASKEECGMAFSYQCPLQRGELPSGKECRIVRSEAF